MKPTLPIFVQRPNDPDSSVYAGQAPETATLAEIAKEAEIDPDRLVEARIIEPRKFGKKRWQVVEI